MFFHDNRVCNLKKMVYIPMSPIPPSFHHFWPLVFSHPSTMRTSSCMFSYACGTIIRNCSRACCYIRQVELYIACCELFTQANAVEILIEIHFIDCLLFFFIGYKSGLYNQEEKHVQTR